MSIDLDDVTAQAARHCAKASAPYVAPEDKGIHRTQEDIWEQELIAEKWKPLALHPHSAIWRSPIDGLLHGGLGACWLLMKAGKREPTI
jgi:hypothetical protein